MFYGANHELFSQCMAVGFATIPAYLADIFWNICMLGGIHGRLFNPHGNRWGFRPFGHHLI